MRCVVVLRHTSLPVNVALGTRRQARRLQHTQASALVGHTPSAPSTVNKALASAKPLELILLLKVKKYKAEKYGNMEISKKKKKSESSLSPDIFHVLT